MSSVSFSLKETDIVFFSPTHRFINTHTHNSECDNYLETNRNELLGTSKNISTADVRWEIPAASKKTKKQQSETRVVSVLQGKCFIVNEKKLQWCSVKVKPVRATPGGLLIRLFQQGMGIKIWSQIIRNIRMKCLRVNQFLSPMLTVACYKIMTSNSCTYAAGNLQWGVFEERKRWSKAWFHFMKKDDNSACRNVFIMVVVSQGGNTSNTLKHLSMQHGLKFHERHVFDTNIIYNRTSGAHTQAADDLTEI